VKEGAAIIYLAPPLLTGSSGTPKIVKSLKLKVQSSGVPAYRQAGAPLTI